MCEFELKIHLLRIIHPVCSPPSPSTQPQVYSSWQWQHGSPLATVLCYSTADNQCAVRLLALRCGNRKSTIGY